MYKKKAPNDRQLKLVFNRNTSYELPIDYTFTKNRHFAHLRKGVEEDMKELVGSGIGIEKEALTPEMRRKINAVLEMRGFIANFKEDRIEIVEAPTDISGEYYADYAKGRK